MDEMVLRVGGYRVDSSDTEEGALFGHVGATDTRETQHLSAVSITHTARRRRGDTTCF